jgi:hypothetical protein
MTDRADVVKRAFERFITDWMRSVTGLVGQRAKLKLDRIFGLQVMCNAQAWMARHDDAYATVQAFLEDPGDAVRSAVFASMFSVAARLDGMGSLGDGRLAALHVTDLVSNFVLKFRNTESLVAKIESHVPKHYMKTLLELHREGASDADSCSGQRVPFVRSSPRETECKGYLVCTTELHAQYMMLKHSARLDAYQNAMMAFYDKYDDDSSEEAAGGGGDERGAQHGAAGSGASTVSLSSDDDTGPTALAVAALATKVQDLRRDMGMLEQLVKTDDDRLATVQTLQAACRDLEARTVGAEQIALAADAKADRARADAEAADKAARRAFKMLDRLGRAAVVGANANAKVAAADQNVPPGKTQGAETLAAVAATQRWLAAAETATETRLAAAETATETRLAAAETRLAAAETMLEAAETRLAAVCHVSTEHEELLDPQGPLARLHDMHADRLKSLTADHADLVLRVNALERCVRDVATEVRSVAAQLCADRAERAERQLAAEARPDQDLAKRLAVLESQMAWMMPQFQLQFVMRWNTVMQEWQMQKSWASAPGSVPAPSAAP